MKTVVAGDWHGNTVATRRAMHFAQKFGASEVFQVGDFGFGWRQVASGDAMIDACSRAASAYEVDLFWLDGNHENFDKLEEIGAFGAQEPVELAPRVFYVPRGCVIERDGKRALVIGGAYSVDKKYRTPHKSWWPQEEITHADLERCYEAGEVDVVFSHDAPHPAFVAALTLAADGDLAEADHLVWKNDLAFPGAAPNRMALQSVLESANPRLWVHGHYHTQYEALLANGTFVYGLDMETEAGSLVLLDWEENPVDIVRLLA